MSAAVRSHRTKQAIQTTTKKRLQITMGEVMVDGELLDLSVGSKNKNHSSTLAIQFYYKVHSAGAEVTHFFEAGYYTKNGTAELFADVRERYGGLPAAWTAIIAGARFKYDGGDCSVSTFFEGKLARDMTIQFIKTNGERDLEWEARRPEKAAELHAAMLKAERERAEQRRQELEAEEDPEGEARRLEEERETMERDEAERRTLSARRHVEVEWALAQRLALRRAVAGAQGRAKRARKKKEEAEAWAGVRKDYPDEPLEAWEEAAAAAEAAGEKAAAEAEAEADRTEAAEKAARLQEWLESEREMKEEAAAEIRLARALADEAATAAAAAARSRAEAAAEAEERTAAEALEAEGFDAEAYEETAEEAEEQKAAEERRKAKEAVESGLMETMLKRCLSESARYDFDSEARRLVVLHVECLLTTGPAQEEEERVWWKDRGFNVEMLMEARLEQWADRAVLTPHVVEPRPRAGWSKPTTGADDGSEPMVVEPVEVRRALVEVQPVRDLRAVIDARKLASGIAKKERRSAVLSACREGGEKKYRAGVLVRKQRDGGGKRSSSHGPYRRANSGDVPYDVVE